MADENEILGTIPTELGLLAEMETLELSKWNTTKIFLSFLQLTITLPCIVLTIEVNRLSGPIPTSLGLLTQLLVLLFGTDRTF